MLSAAIIEGIERYIFAGRVGFGSLPSIDLRIRKKVELRDRSSYVYQAPPSSPIYPSRGRRESDGMDIYCMSLLVSGLYQESTSGAQRGFETEAVANGFAICDLCPRGSGKEKKMIA